VWPVTLRSVGGADARWITGHVAAAQPSWIGGKPTIRRGHQLYGIDLSVSPIRLLRQGGNTSQPAPGAHLGSNEVLVLGPPHATRRTTRPARRALPIPAPRIRRVGGVHSTRRSDEAAHRATPDSNAPLSEVARQLVTHVKPVPHSLLQNRTKTRVTPPPSPALYQRYPRRTQPIAQPRPLE
jgi:hypothetical protein